MKNLIEIRIHKIYRSVLFAILFSLLNPASLKAQKINWLSFEQLNDSLKINSKNVFISFNTSWCLFCRKMDQLVYTNPPVVKLLNEDFYAVKMDAETTDSIFFDGQEFVNKQAQKSQRGFHELALLLGQRDGMFAPPTMLVLDKDFRILDRYFEYMDSGKLLKFLNSTSESPASSK